jgi:hypothetical protein
MATAGSKKEREWQLLLPAVAIFSLFCFLQLLFFLYFLFLSYFL